MEKEIEGFKYNIPKNSRVIGILTEDKEEFNLILSPKIYENN